MKTSIIGKAAVILLVLALPQSCTDLDTTLYSDLTPNTEYTITANGEDGTPTLILNNSAS